MVIPSFAKGMPPWSRCRYRGINGNTMAHARQLMIQAEAGKQVVRFVVFPFQIKGGIGETFSVF